MWCVLRNQQKNVLKLGEWANSAFDVGTDDSEFDDVVPVASRIAFVVGTDNSEFDEVVPVASRIGKIELSPETAASEDLAVENNFLNWCHHSKTFV